MKASELRIGNLALYNNKPCSIDGMVNVRIFGHCVIIGDNEPAIKEISPIPLSEEWLVKFGFEEAQNKWFGKKYFGSEDADDVNLINVNSASSRCNITTVNSECVGAYSVEIKYVHQLQNLYFALTGEELVITPSTPANYR